jgi:hypothetical protein
LVSWFVRIARFITDASPRLDDHPYRNVWLRAGFGGTPCSTMT